MITLKEEPSLVLPAPHRARSRRRFAILPGLGLALILILGPGCQLLPRKPHPPAQQPPQVPQAPPQSTAPGTVSVDLTNSIGQNGFKNEVTEDQKFGVHLDFGRIFESQGNYEAALLEYQEALTVAEAKGFGKSRSLDQSLAHRRMGSTLDRLGRFAQAEVHYKKALKLSPRDPKVWNDAGYSYYLQGRWADAERALKTAAEFAPDDPRIKTNLGLVLAAAGRTQEALPLLGQVNGDAAAHANLGYLLAATGQVDLARQQYEQALAIRPDLALARRALAQLDRAQNPGPMMASSTAKPETGPVAVRPSGSTNDSRVLQTSTPAPRRQPVRASSNTLPPLPSRGMP